MSMLQTSTELSKTLNQIYLSTSFILIIIDCNNIDVNDIQDVLLSQSKSYLKILSIPYLMEGTNMPINSIVMEAFIKLTHIFNNIKNVSKLCIVKMSSKSDMAIVWINI